MPNLLKNIKISAQQDNVKAVLAGLTVLDNLSRVDEGKEALKKNNAIEEIAKVAEILEKHDKIIQMSAKIFSKISKPEDMIKELKTIESIQAKQDYNDCN